MPSGFLLTEGFILNNQFLINLLKDKYNKLLYGLTLTYINDMGIKKQIKLFKYHKDNNNSIVIQLPRKVYYTLSQNNIISDKNIEIRFPINKITIPPYPKLFDYQNVAVEYLMDKVFTEANAKKGLGSCVLEMGAGLGKTRTMAGLISKLGMKTLYIVPTLYLVKQTIEDLTLAFESHKINIAHITTKTLQKECDIGVIVVNTAIKVPLDYIKKYSFIIYDELQCYCSPTFSNIFWRTYSLYNIGITATATHRIDKFDDIYKIHLSQFIKAKDIPNFNTDNYKWTGNAQIIQYTGPNEYTGLEYDDFGKVNVHKIKTKLFQDPYRLKLICFHIKELLKDPKNDIFIFCEYKNYLNSIKMVLENNKINCDIDCDIDSTEDSVEDSPEESPEELSDDNEKSYENSIDDDIAENDPNELNENNKLVNTIIDTQVSTPVSAPVLTLVSAPVSAPVSAVASVSTTNNTIQVKNDKAELLVGGIKDADIAIVKRSRVTLTTYAYSEKGISIPSKNCIVLASSKKTGFIQILGRIFRRGGDVSIPRIVIDIYDTKVGFYWRHLLNRKTAYREYNLDINQKKINYEIIE